LTHIAVGVDVRTGTQGFQAALQKLRKQGVSPTVVFLDSDNTTLLRRFPKPGVAIPERFGPLGYPHGARHLHEVKALADKIIDTSRLTPTEMKEVVVRTLGLQHRAAWRSCSCPSGYKYGFRSTLI